jgi:hypothetical protein
MAGGVARRCELRRFLRPQNRRYPSRFRTRCRHQSQAVEQLGLSVKQ